MPWPSSGWGWASFLLPELEQSNLAGRINYNLNVGDPSPAVASARATFL